MNFIQYFSCDIGKKELSRQIKVVADPPTFLINQLVSSSINDGALMWQKEGLGFVFETGFALMTLEGELFANNSDTASAALGFLETVFEEMVAA